MIHTMVGDVSGPVDRTKFGPARIHDASSQELQKKPNISRCIWVFIIQVIAEMKKVAYPAGEETQIYFVIATVFVAVIVALTGLLDLGFGKLNALIFGRRRADPPAGICRRVSSTSRQPREPGT